MQLLYKLYFDAYKCMSISMCYWIRNQVNVILFLELLTTILYKTRWDTCSTNHHYVHKSRCMCTKRHVWFNVHVLSMRLPPPPAMLVYICLLFIRSALSLTTLILGSGEQRAFFITKCPNSFVQDCRIVLSSF